MTMTMMTTTIKERARTATMIFRRRGLLFGSHKKIIMYHSCFDYSYCRDVVCLMWTLHHRSLVRPWREGIPRRDVESMSSSGGPDNRASIF